MAAGQKTGGRQKGTPNRSTAERQAAVVASGLTPLDYMLEVLRDDQQPAERRDEMAKAAAPYVHPRLASVEQTGKDGGAITMHHTIEQVIVDPHQGGASNS